MPGLAIPLDGTLTDPVFPRLRNDEILSSGSLLLLDCSHTYGGFGSGVPVDNQLIENIAWKEAIATVLSGSQNSMRATADIYAGAGFSMERTGRGGLHFMLSQAGDLAASTGAEILLPSELRSYLQANPTNDIYLSAWTRLTKVAGLNGSVWPATVALQRTVSSTSNYLAFFDANDTFPLGSSAKNLGERLSNGTNTLGNSLRSVAVDGWTGTPPASAAELRNGIVLAGARGAYTGLALSDDAPSFILYRLYLEDLTVSGRDFADVDAIDFAAFTREFATGGKFAGDTFTSP